jgi:hypothetical protein
MRVGRSGGGCEWGEGVSGCIIIGIFGGILYILWWNIIYFNRNMYLIGIFGI